MTRMGPFSPTMKVDAAHISRLNLYVQFDIPTPTAIGHQSSYAFDLVTARLGPFVISRLSQKKTRPALEHCAQAKQQTRI